MPTKISLGCNYHTNCLKIDTTLLWVDFWTHSSNLHINGNQNECFILISKSKLAFYRLKKIHIIQLSRSTFGAHKKSTRDLPDHLIYTVDTFMIWLLSITRGPVGHLLDTAIRCFRAKRVGITIAEKMAVEKLQFHWMSVWNKPCQKSVPSSDTDQNSTLCQVFTCSCNLNMLIIGFNWQVIVRFCLS